MKYLPTNVQPFRTDRGRCEHALSTALFLSVVACQAEVLPDADVVGTQSQGIFYGSDVPDGRYPWLTKLPNCSGALISPHFVLSAAHCYGYGQRNAQGTLEGIDITSGPVRIGHPDYNHANAQRYNVRRVSLHPEYIKLTRDEVWGKEPYDIVLLELETPVYQTKYLQLPTREPTEGEIIIAAGWGLTEDGYVSHARETTVQVRSRASCFSGDAKRFCSRGAPSNPTSNIGPGDSGGPVFVSDGDGDGYRVLGTNSTGNGDSADTYATHATTFVFMQWLLDVTQGEFTCRNDNPADGCSVNTDECDAGLDNCHAAATCRDLADGFSCECKPGYEGDGTHCSDIDECAENTDDCGPGALCVNEEGSFACRVCPDGFEISGSECTDVDECARGSHGCAADATCTNTSGSYTCACNAGFEGSGVACSDTDECADGTDNCSVDRVCTNAVGSFDCTCNDGFVGDAVGCDREESPVAPRLTLSASGSGCSTTHAESGVGWLWGVWILCLQGLCLHRRRRTV